MMHALFNLSGLGKDAALSGREADAPLSAPAQYRTPILGREVEEGEWEDDGDAWDDAEEWEDEDGRDDDDWDEDEWEEYEEEFEEEDERPARRREDDW